MNASDPYAWMRDRDLPAMRKYLGAGAHTGPSGRFGQLGYEAEILAFIVDAAARDRG
jgi:protease II